MPLVFKLSGDAEIQRNLEKIAYALHQDAITAALLDAGEIVVDKAKSIAPVESGLLKQSITLLLREGRGRRRGTNYIVIGADRAVSGPGPDGRRRVPANYAHLVEHGHAIATVGTNQATRNAIRGASVGPAIQLVPPKPFLRPAVMGSRGAVRARFIAALQDFHRRITGRSN